jgi:CBS domain containing-hemolysin-like protein
MSEVPGNRAAGRNGNGDSTLTSLWQRLRGLVGARNGDSQLRDAIEEIIGEVEDTSAEQPDAPIGTHEKLMLANILKLRHVTAYDVMVPRADIVSLDVKASLDEVLDTLISGGHSRLPVYRENLDDVIGLVHIKDVLPFARGKSAFDLASILRDISIVAPSMRALDLLLEMRLTRVHLAVVVDEFGGIDGLVTIEDLVEQIVGEIDDEHDVVEGPSLVERPDGSLVADARTEIEELEERIGPVLSEEEREEDIDTLGGLVFYLADRVPARGELILHPHSGITFEVLDADPRRVKRVRLRDLPRRHMAAQGAPPAAEPNKDD